MELAIDIAFDFRSDTPPGKDPDVLSPKLHQYHQLLWSKPLPNGTLFELLDARSKGYLRHNSALGEFFLSSDSVIPSFRKERTRRLSSVFDNIPEEDQIEFLRVTYTIGGMMLFPSNKVEGKMTINGARGCSPRIKDRFDLTIECIRLYFLGEPSPLRDVLERYKAFFALFEDFRGYIDFFLLQDIVTDDYRSLRFHAPFVGFDQSPVPANLDEYLAYRERATMFITQRNQRIVRFAMLANIR